MKQQQSPVPWACVTIPNKGRISGEGSLAPSCVCMCVYMSVQTTLQKQEQEAKTNHSLINTVNVFSYDRFLRDMSEAKL